VAIDSAEASDYCILEPGRFLILFELAGVRRYTRKAEDIEALHRGIHFFERACFNERMNPFSRANLNDIRSWQTQVFIQLFIIQHGRTLQAFV
jgi:hypothetical protein